MTKNQPEGEKKKTPIWHALTILGVFIVGVIGSGAYIYWETLFPESHKKTMKAMGEVATQAKTTARSSFKDLLTNTDRIRFKAQGLPLCQEAESQTETPKGWHYRNLTSVLGLPKNSGRDDVLARCRQYVKAIEKMQDLSGPKANYEVICTNQGTYFEIDAKRGYSIYPTETGVRQKVTGTIPSNLRVQRGQTVLIVTTQAHGLGNGCYVIGSDKLSTFKRSGEVKKVKSAKPAR